MLVKKELIALIILSLPVAMRTAIAHRNQRRTIVVFKRNTVKDLLQCIVVEYESFASFSNE